MYLDRDYRGKAPKNGVMFVDAPRSDLGQMGKIFSRMKKEIEAQKSIIKNI